MNRNTNFIALAFAPDFSVAYAALQEISVPQAAHPPMLTAKPPDALSSADVNQEHVALHSEVGQMLQLTIQRNGREGTIEATLEARPCPEEVNP